LQIIELQQIITFWFQLSTICKQALSFYQSSFCLLNENLERKDEFVEKKTPETIKLINYSQLKPSMLLVSG